MTEYFSNVGANTFENERGKESRMIIKEFKKNLVILKGVGCDYIDEAFIILKGNLPHEIKGSDIVKEANRIIAEYKTGKKRKRFSFSLPSFLLGAVAAGVLAVLVGVLIL